MMQAHPATAIPPEPAPTPRRYRYGTAIVLAAIILIGGGSVASLASCATFPADQVWTARNENLKGGLKVELAIPDGAAASFRISGKAIAGATISGFAVRSGEGWELTPTGLDWFNNWINGWTEAHFIMDGKIRLQPAEGGWRLVAENPPEIDVPDRARLRYMDQYYQGDKAVDKMSRRWERIQAAALALRAQFPGEWWIRTFPEFNLAKFAMEPNFQEGVRQYLFPEVYGYKTPPAPGFKVKLAESIFWNTDYSLTAIPEELRPVRDSGTLFRDFEESPELWHLAFGWKRLWEDMIPALLFPAAPD